MTIVTLTSDFGTQSYLPGSTKGCLLSCSNSLLLVDISHEIEPYNYNEALYIFGSAWKNFPKNTWHILLVNLFEIPEPRILLAWHQGHYFAVPDNGLLPLVLEGMPEHYVTLAIKNETHSILNMVTGIGNAIAAMEKGKAFHQLGNEPESILQKSSPQPAIGKDYIEGQIIFIDRFENVVINIRKKTFDDIGKGRPFKISLTLNEKIERLHQHYGEVREGDKLAFFNQSGFLEIAINKGNAAGLFGLRTASNGGNASSSASRIFYERVRVVFFDN